MRAVAVGCANAPLVHGARVGLLQSTAGVRHLVLRRAACGLAAVPINSGYTKLPGSPTTWSNQALQLRSRMPRRRQSPARWSAVPIIEVRTEDWRRLLVGKTPPPLLDTDIPRNSRC